MQQKRKVAKFLQLDSNEQNIGQKAAEFFKAQSANIKKESPAQITISSQLPNIGSLSQKGLKENDGHMGNKVDGANVKESRYASGGPSQILTESLANL